MSKQPDVYLDDIRREIEVIEQFCGDLDYDEFVADEKLKRAVVRSQ